VSAGSLSRGSKLSLLCLVGWECGCGVNADWGGEVVCLSCCTADPIQYNDTENLTWAVISVSRRWPVTGVSQSPLVTMLAMG